MRARSLLAVRRQQHGDRKATHSLLYPQPRGRLNTRKEVDRVGTTPTNSQPFSPASFNLLSNPLTSSSGSTEKVEYSHCFRSPVLFSFATPSSIISLSGYGGEGVALRWCSSAPSATARGALKLCELAASTRGSSIGRGREPAESRSERCGLIKNPAIEQGLIASDARVQRKSKAKSFLLGCALGPL
jgi:hypothetical protein